MKFSEYFAGQTIVLTSGELLITNSLTILGPGTTRLAISGNGSSRVFSINSGTVIYTGNGIRIGDAVAIAANCTLAPTNHAIADRDRLIKDQGFQPSKGGIVLEDDVWLGAGVVVLDGAVVRRGAVIGAGSVVRGEVEAYAIYAGAPARKIGERGG